MMATFQGWSAQTKDKVKHGDYVPNAGYPEHIRRAEEETHRRTSLSSWGQERRHREE